MVSVSRPAGLLLQFIVSQFGGGNSRSCRAMSHIPDSGDDDAVSSESQPFQSLNRKNLPELEVLAALEGKLLLLLADGALL